MNILEQVFLVKNKYSNAEILLQSNSINDL